MDASHFSFSLCRGGNRSLLLVRSYDVISVDRSLSCLVTEEQAVLFEVSGQGLSFFYIGLLGGSFYGPCFPS